MVHFIQAISDGQLEAAKELFREYASSLDFCLNFQGFDEELMYLPGDYSPPKGQLLLAVEDINSMEAVGCVALKKIDEQTCEMKRLYVLPHFRGKNIGKSLVTAIMEEAQKIGYIVMLLDTVSSMKEAISIYRNLGFIETMPYRYNPIEDALFMKKRFERKRDKTTILVME